jgi:hypothetical protein
MNYEDAMYNCLLRRATLVSFNQKVEDEEIHEYWKYSTYFQNAFEIGLITFNLVICSFLLRYLWKDVIYYWTSGALLNTYELGNVFWCSTNLTSEVSISPKLGESGKKCVAYERWTGKFVELNCSKQLSFVCEVEYMIVIHLP